MCKIGSPDKVIFLAVIIADEGQRQGAHDIFAVSVLWLCAVFINKPAFDVAPWTRLRKQLFLHLFRKMKQHNIKLYVNRVAIVIEIAAGVKVMFIDDGAAIGALWPENQFQRFADCRLARIVAAHKKCVASEIN